MAVHFEDLTEQQRRCLRLVARGMSSKEIAIALRLSPHTVDRYLQLAKEKLGAGNRREAAKQLEAYEASPQYKEFIYYSEAVAAVHPSVIVEEEEPEGHPGSETNRVDDDSVRTNSGMDMKARLKLVAGLAFPIGGRTNDLGTAHRITAIMRLSLMSVISFIAIYLIADGAFRLFG